MTMKTVRDGEDGDESGRWRFDPGSGDLEVSCSGGTVGGSAAIGPAAALGKIMLTDFAPWFLLAMVLSAVWIGWLVVLVIKLAKKPVEPTASTSVVSSFVRIRGPQPRRGTGSGRALRLARTGLDQQGAARSQPGRGTRGNPTMYVDAVAASVESDVVLVQPGLGRHQPDLVGGDVRRVHREQVDPAAEARRQCVVQVALVDLPHRDVASCAGDRVRIQVRGVQLHLEPPGDRHADRAGPATEVDHHRARCWSPAAPPRVRPAPRCAGAGRTRPGRRRCAGRRTPPSRAPARAVRRRRGARASAPAGRRRLPRPAAAAPPPRRRHSRRRAGRRRSRGRAPVPSQATTRPRSTICFGSWSTARSSSGLRS